MSKILVTGGAGYIGSHVCVELLNAGYEIIVVDNLECSSEKALKNIKQITNKDFIFYKTDLLDMGGLEKIFQSNRVDAVIHIAGLKSVEGSLSNPQLYYQNNVGGTLNLVIVMDNFNVNKIVFSSSAAVYGENENIPIKENNPLCPANPYGKSKLMIEQILRDIHHANPRWGISILRYFNVVGAHKSGKLGENNLEIQTHLASKILQVIAGKIEKLEIYGEDYDTDDGTCIRDYIHVMDLANAHIKALEQIDISPCIQTYNIGTGRGYSVRELIQEFEKITGKKVNYIVTKRREGDIAISIADPSLAEKELGWRATQGLTEMCEDSWKWHIKSC